MSRRDLTGNAGEGKMGGGIHAENIGIWAETKQTFAGFSQAIQQYKRAARLWDRKLLQDERQSLIIVERQRMEWGSRSP